MRYTGARGGHQFLLLLGRIKEAIEDFDRKLGTSSPSLIH